MNRIFIVTLLLINLSLTARAQSRRPMVFTSDIDNFWRAFDSIQTTSDSLKQVKFIQTIYINNGTKGLRTFMDVRDYSAEGWIKLINLYPKFWRSIRPNTFSIKSKAKSIEKSITRLKTLYPDLREATVYFTIGGLRSGGTTMEDMVLIGAEIATGDASTDVSEFPDKWLAGVFRKQQTLNIVPLNIHEYIHTQQKGEAHNLLGQSIKEGSCDFITELVMGEPLHNNYISFGNEHQADLKEKFKQEMFSPFFYNWLYNGGKAVTVADLGYFMGYAICKSYYNHSPIKKQAIRNIIELNYSDSIAVEKFLEQSKYYVEAIDKRELMARFENKRPNVLRLDPFPNGDTLVEPSIKVIKIDFSAPMNPKGYSISFGKGGKEYSPITGVLGFSPSGESFTLKVNLKPNHEYEFILTDRGFQSLEGYPLKTYEVKFKTK